MAKALIDADGKVDRGPKAVVAITRVVKMRKAVAGGEGGAGMRQRAGLQLISSRKNPRIKRWMRPGEAEGGPRGKKRQEDPAKKRSTTEKAGEEVDYTDPESGESLKGVIAGKGAQGVTVRDSETGKLVKVEHGNYIAGDPNGEDEDTDKKEAKDARPRTKRGADGDAANGGGGGDTAPSADDGGDAADDSDEPHIFDLPLPSLPDGFNDLPKGKRAKLTAHWSEVKEEMDQRFGVHHYPDDSISDAVQTAHAHLQEMSDEGWIGTNNIAFGEGIVSTLGEHLDAAGVDPADAAVIMADTVRKLGHQEIEAARRTLGDHGLRHIGRNIEQVDKVLQALGDGGKNIDPKDRLATTLAMVSHDMGYTIPAIARGGFAVKDNYHPEAGALLWRQQLQEEPAFARALGADRARDIARLVVTHSHSKIDWERDPLGSAMRLADNTHLFADKMPEILFERPGAVEIMAKLHLAKESGSDWKPLRKQLMAHVEARADLSPPQKTALMQAVKEIGPMTPKFLISRLAGRDMTMEYDHDTRSMNVDIEQSPMRKFIGDIFGDDHKDVQFVKMLGDFGTDATAMGKIKGGGIAATLEGDNGSSIRMNWTPPKTNANRIEQRYIGTMRRVRREWGRVQGMPEDSKQRTNAQRSFFAQLSKARAALMELLKAVTPTARQNNPKLMLKPSKSNPRIKRWQKTGQDAPAQRGPAQAEEKHPSTGAKVQFRTPGSGDVGEGKIHKTSTEGASIVDKAGRVHRVPHGHYSIHEAAKQKPAQMTEEQVQAKQKERAAGLRKKYPGLNRYPPLELGPDDVEIGDKDVPWTFRWRHPKTGKSIRAYSTSYLRSNAEKKFQKVRGFGHKLPELRESARKQVEGLHPSSNMAVMAAMALIVDLTLMRAGGGHTGTQGLTTLKKSNVSIDGEVVTFKYIGKSKVPQVKKFRDASLAALIGYQLEQPGEDLWMTGHAGAPKRITAQALNGYIRDHAAGASIKDFRTWHATRLFSEAAAKLGKPTSDEDATEKIRQAALSVAKKLGHRKKVTKKGRSKWVYEPTTALDNYIDFTVVEAYRKGLMMSGKLEKARGGSMSYLSADDKAFNGFLEQVHKFDPFGVKKTPEDDHEQGDHQDPAKAVKGDDAQGESGRAGPPKSSPRRARVR